MLRRHGPTIYVVVVGIVLVALSWEAGRSDSEAAAAAFATFGAGALIAAPFTARIYGKLRLGPIEMNLRDRAVNAIEAAPLEIVNAVLPFLEQSDLSVEVVTLPARFEGRAMTAPELGFIRKDLNVQVVGVRPPTSAKWLAGGEISALELPRDAALIAVGSNDSLRELRARFAAAG